MSTYGDVHRELAKRVSPEHPTDPGDALLPCAYCAEPTSRRTLAALGARCQQCFAQYQRLGYSGTTPPPVAKQAPWVKAAAGAARSAKAASAAGVGRNAFAELTQAMQAQQAERQMLRDLTDDEVNELLQEARG